MSRTVVQLVTPISIQVLSVPLHLHALDLYNRPVAKDRMAFIGREYTKASISTPRFFSHISNIDRFGKVGAHFPCVLCGRSVQHSRS